MITRSRNGNKSDDVTPSCSVQVILSPKDTPSLGSSRAGGPRTDRRTTSTVPKTSGPLGSLAVQLFYNGNHQASNSGRKNATTCKNGQRVG